MFCMVCGDGNADCGKFVDRDDTVRHIGTCCIELAESINASAQKTTYKYAT